MKRWRLLLVTAAVFAVGALLVPGASAKAFGGPSHSYQGTHRALFVQTNNLSANQIMVYDRAGNGTLAFVASYATGGKGGMAAGAAADPLASQGSLVTADHGRLLLAVNAGSDTVSLFRVRGDHLRLKQVIASGGDFPVSIAVYRHLVYVLNAGDQGSVQGYWLGGDHLWRIALLTPCTRPGQHQPARLPALARAGRLHSRRPATDRHDQGQHQRHRRLLGSARSRRAEQGWRCQPPGLAGALRLHLRPDGSPGGRRGGDEPPQHLHAQARQQPDHDRHCPPTARRRPAGSAPPAASTTSPTPAAAT